ncbi:hypothetical protein E8E14_006994 [Neopestalotiopsis sp. 37M]|nr:hypothetical protein E8E14_006994 [Neopestalotiopsis sp. 37M]
MRSSTFHIVLGSFLLNGAISAPLKTEATRELNPTRDTEPSLFKRSSKGNDVAASGQVARKASDDSKRSAELDGLYMMAAHSEDDEPVAEKRNSDVELDGLYMMRYAGDDEPAIEQRESDDTKLDGLYMMGFLVEDEEPAVVVKRDVADKDGLYMMWILEEDEEPANE